MLSQKKFIYLNQNTLNIVRRRDFVLKNKLKKNFQN